MPGVHWQNPPGGGMFGAGGGIGFAGPPAGAAVVGVGGNIHIGFANPINPMFGAGAQVRFSPVCGWFIIGSGQGGPNNVPAPARLWVLFVPPWARG